MGLESFGVPAELATPVEGEFAFEPTTAIDAVQRWLADPDARILVLSGTVGTGKSQAAAYCVGEFWDQTWQAPPFSPLRRRGVPLWISAREIGKVAPWDDDVDRWSAAGLLVIDDLGLEEGTPKQRALVDAAIVDRHAKGRRTLITTNVGQGDFVARYGARITDRLRESGLDAKGKARWWVACTGDSMRGVTRPTPPGDTDIVDEPPAISHERAVEIVEAAGLKVVADLADQKQLRQETDDGAKRRLREQFERLKRARRR